MPRCRAETPALFAAGPRQIARCLLYEQAPVLDAHELGPLLQTTLPKETTP